MSAELNLSTRELQDELDLQMKRVRRFSLLPGEWDLPQHLVRFHNLSYEESGQAWTSAFLAHLRVLRLDANGVEQVMYKCKGGDGHLITVPFTGLTGDRPPTYVCKKHNILTQATLPQPNK